MASEFIEILSPDAEAQLKAIMPLVEQLANNIKSINGFKTSSTPSGSDKGIQGMNDAYKAQSSELEQIKKKLAMISSLNKQRYQEEAKLIADHDKALIFQSQNELKQEKKAAEESIKTSKAKLSMISSLNKQRYSEEAKLAADAEKAMLHKYQEELKQIKAKQAMIYSLGQQQLKEEAQNAKWSRTGASSTIPGMGSKIADIKETERLLQANKKLNDAYGQLTTKRNEAARALQNSIIETGKSSKATQQLQKDFDILNKKVGQADNAIGKMSQANNGLKALTSSVSNLMGAFGISMGIGLVVDIGKNIYETTKQLQSLDLALKMVSGTQEEYASNQAFITNISEKWGLEIKDTTEQFTQFYTAAKGLMSESQIKETFEGIAKAGALMGLSVDKQQAAFYALEQMMSKGTVTSEELKKQLGNAMPGAMKAAGMAYMELHPKIKTIQEAEQALMSEMKKGAIDSATYVPLIVKNLNKLYGTDMVDKVDTLAAAQNRLSNSWTELIRRVTGGKSIFSSIISSFMDSMIWWLDNAESVLKYTSLLGYSISKIYEITHKEEIKFNKSITNQENARKKAMADIEKITEKEKKLTIALTVKNNELDKYEKIRKTSKGSNLVNVDNRIKKTKEEIATLETQIKQEGVLNKQRKEFRINEAVSNNKKLEVETNKILLDRVNLLDKQKELSKQIDDNRESKDYDVSLDKKLLIEKENLNLLISEKESLLATNNARIAYNNSIIKTKDIEQKKVEGKKGETEDEKAENDRLKREAELSKNAYDRRMSDLEREKETLKDYRDDEENHLESRLLAEKAYGLKEVQIAQTIYEEKVKIAEKEALNEADLDNLKKQATNELLTSQENALSESLDRQTKLKEDALKKEQEKTKEWYKNNPPIGIIETSEQKEAREKAEKDKLDAEKKAYEARIKAFNDFVGDFADKSGFGESFDLFGKLDKDGKSMFGKLMEDAEKTGDEWKVVMNGMVTVAQDTFNFISEASQKRFEEQYARLEKEKEVAISFAGDSDSAKKKIEEDYEKRRKVIAKREFKAKQQQTIVNIAMDTAQAIMQIWSHSPDPTGISQGLMTGIISALGAIQIGIVASQKMPQYWKGTDNAQAGLAWTQERGAEIILDKNDRIKSLGSSGGAKLTMMEKGDKVKTASETKQIMFDNDLNSIMASNGISNAPKIEIKNGMTKGEMKEVMMETLGSMPMESTIIDVNGFKRVISNGHSRTITNSNRVSGKGIRV